MNYEFLYNGEIKSIKMEPDRTGDGNNGYLVSMGDQPIRLYLSPISINSYSLIDSNNSIVAYAAESDDSVFVYIGGRAIRFGKVTDDPKSFLSGGMEFGAKDQVSTPMPGKVVKIMVKEGDSVKIRQSLVIVESMKMENEIKSPTNGQVKSIHFSAGDLVEPGKAIIKLIPSEQTEE